MPNPRVVVTGGGSGVEGKIEFVNDIFLEQFGQVINQFKSEVSIEDP